MCPNTVTRSTHVCHQEHTPLWRYAQRWWRWQRAGLDGLVSLKGGLRRVVIRQLRILGIVGFPLPDIRCPDRHLEERGSHQLPVEACILQVLTISCQSRNRFPDFTVPQVDVCFNSCSGLWQRMASKKVEISRLALMSLFQLPRSNLASKTPSPGQP